jgi:hypothetical protein
MKDKTTIKQFNFAHLRVDEKLHGANLASFTRRFLAYSLDWIIIIVCTQFLFLIIPLFLLFLIFKRKLHYTIVKSRRIIKRSVLMAGKKLEENTLIAPSLKRRFTRGMVFYIYVLLYLPVIATFLYRLDCHGIFFTSDLPERFGQFNFSFTFNIAACI